MLLRHRHFMGWVMLFHTALVAVVAYTATAPIPALVIVACIMGSLTLALQYVIGANLKDGWVGQLPIVLKQRLLYSTIGIIPVILIAFSSAFYMVFGEVGGATARMTVETILVAGFGLYLLLCSIHLLNILYNRYDIVVAVIGIMLGSLAVGWSVASALIAISS